MAIYRAQFRWSLPPTPSTATDFAAALSVSAGYPCGAHVLRHSEAELVAALSLPRIAKNNTIALSHGLCTLEFAPVAFFWGHATRCVQELGGTFAQPVMSDRADWRRQQWPELKWTDRARILLGFDAV